MEQCYRHFDHKERTLISWWQKEKHRLREKARRFRLSHTSISRRIPVQLLSRHAPVAHVPAHTPQWSARRAQSEHNEPVRPHSQNERPPVGPPSPGIETSPRSLVLSRPVKKAF